MTSAATAIQQDSASGLDLAAADRPRSGLLALLFAVAAPVLVLFAGTDDASPSRIWTMALATLCIGVSGALFISRRTGLLVALSRGKFGPWASLSFAVAFGATSLQWLQPQDGTAAMISRDSVVTALGVVMLGQILWIAGYLASILSPLHTSARWVFDRVIPPEGADRQWRTSGVWLLFTMGLVGQGFRIYTNGFGYLADAQTSVSSFSGLGQVSAILSNMGLYAVVLAAVNYFSTRRQGGLGALVIVATVQVGLGLIQGVKEGVALTSVAIILSYALVRGRLPLKFFVVCVLLFTFVAVPFVTAYRDAVRGGGTDGSIGSAVAAAPGVAAQEIENGQFSKSYIDLAARLRMIDSLAIVTQRSPGQIAYASPAELVVQPVIGLVPRIFWPGKPGYLSGYEFTQTYYGLPPSVISASAVTPPGDLYRHGGLTILLLGMFFLGGVYRLLDDMIRATRDFRHLFVVVSMFPLLVKHEADVVSILLSIPVTLVGVAIAVRLLALVGERE